MSDRHEQEPVTGQDEGSAWKQYSQSLKAANSVSPNNPEPHSEGRFAYGAALVGTLLVGLLLGRASVGGGKGLTGAAPSDIFGRQQPLMTSSKGLSLGLRYDPYFNGYVREVGFQFQTNTNVYESYVLDPSVVKPPPGVTVRIVRPDLMGRYRTVTGGPGIPTGDQRAQLASCIRSLLKFEEHTIAVDGSIPTVDYDKAPWQPNVGNYMGQPIYVGWHDVEVETTAGRWRFLLPDHRYAKGKEEAFQKTLDQRLLYHIDQKVFSDIGPYGSEFPEKSIDFSSKIELPTGVSVILHDDKKAYYARGPKFDPSKVSDDLDSEMVKLQNGMIALFEEVANQDRFKKMSSKEAKEFFFSTRVVFPMGEHQYFVNVTMLRDPHSKDLAFRLKDWCYAAGFALSGLRSGSTMVMHYHDPSQITYEGIYREADQNVLARYRP